MIQTIGKYIGDFFGWVGNIIAEHIFMPLIEYIAEIAQG